jgi:AcrR family transcriptional regulator
VSTSEEKISGGSYHHGDLRAALVAAAVELVSCCGPTAVSLREVARLVGVSHNAPYRHFPTRQALLAAVAAQGYEMLFQAMKESAEIVDPAEHLQAIGCAYVGFALRHRGIYQLMFSNEVKKSEHPELREIAERAFDSLQQHVMALNPNLHARLATVTVWSLVHGIAHLILDNQLKNYDEDDAQRTELIKTATGILTAGLIHLQPDATATDSDCDARTATPALAGPGRCL